MRSVISSSFVLVIALVLASCGNDSTGQAATGPQHTPPPPADVITVSSGPATTGHDYTASLQGKVDVEIRPQISGFLEKVWVDEGQLVQAGQPLFKINEQPFLEELHNASASLQAAEAAVTNAQLEVEKLEPLVANQIVAEHQIKVARAAHKQALANAERARAEVASAKIRVGYTSVKAPVTGYIGRLPKKIGSLVAPTDLEALTNLSDVHEVYAYFSLGETDFIRFRDQLKGATIEEKVKKLPSVSLVLPDNSVYTSAGKIDMVDGRFDRTTGAITLRAVFPNKNNLLRSGNTGRIRLQEDHENVVLVPQAATVELQDKVFVYTVGQGNKVSKQPLQIKGKSGTDYIIAEGVKAGDRIVVSGLETLTENLVVSPQQVSNNQVSMNR